MSASVTVEIGRARAGMVLSAPLRDGRIVLLPSGATLSAPLLSTLRARGVTTIEVLADSAPVVPQPDPAERARRIERLAHLFRHSGSHEATAQLLALIRAYRQCEEQSHA